MIEWIEVIKLLLPFHYYCVNINNNIQMTDAIWSFIFQVLQFPVIVFFVVHHFQVLQIQLPQQY